MIISNFNTYNTNLSINRTNNVNKNNRLGLSFCAAPNPDVVEPLYKTALGKLKHYSVKEYKALSEAEKLNMRKAYEGSLENMSTEFSFDYTPEQILNKKNNTLSFHDAFAENLRKSLDKQYGKDNYTVIVVGRSLSSVGKVLGYKIGEKNVVNIPMSSASYYCEDTYHRSLERTGKIDSFRKYLNSTGLKKEEIEASDRKYIVLDYCISGNALRGATRLITRDDVLGSKYVSGKSALDFIKNKELRKQAQDFLYYCMFKDLSFVDKTNDVEYLSSFMTDTSKANDRVRLTWFKLLDNEMLHQEAEQAKTNTFFGKLKHFLFGEK